MSYFGRTYTAAFAIVQGRKRVIDTHKLRFLLDSAWNRDILRLHSTLMRATADITDEGLRRRIEVWSSTLRYRIHPETGRVLIWSGDWYLERALFYGTRQLPAVKPLHLLAAYLHENPSLREIVFTARDFHYEPKAKEVAPSHSQPDFSRP